MSLYTAIATSAGRDQRAVSSDGQLDVALGLQKELGGDGIGTNPEQLFAAGYAACFASAMGLVAKRQKVHAADASVTAEVSLNANGEGGFALGVVLHVELPEHLTADQRRTLVDATHQVCPYSNATRGNIPVEIVVD